MEKYAYEKCALPCVVLSAEEKLTALFDYAFETAFRKVDYIEKAGFFDSLKRNRYEFTGSFFLTKRKSRPKEV